MFLNIKKGTTSKRIVVLIQDKTSTTGAGQTGLAFNTSGLVWYYWREDTGNNGGTSVTLATATRGTFTSGGFKEIDATNLPGLYELGVPDAVLAAGSEWAVMNLQSGGNMSPVAIQIQLIEGAVRKHAISGFSFPMFDATGALKTGETVTATRSIDGASFASCTNSAAEIGTTGVYKIDLSTSDLDGSRVLLKFTSGSALPQIISILMEN